MATIIEVLNFIPNGCRASDEFLLALSAAIRERDWGHAYVFAGEPASAFSARLADLGVPWLVGPGHPTVAEAVVLGRRLRVHRPDILQTSFMSKFHPSILALKLASGARHLVTADHTSGAVRRKSAVGRLLSGARGRITGLYTDRVIAVSKFVLRRDVDELSLPEAKMRLVYNGINVNRYRPVAAPPNAMPTIAFAGQLIAAKGVMTLLRAVDLLRRQGVHVRLRLAGIGPQETDLRRYCNESGIEDRVEFLGQIDWIPGLFSHADVVVVPSEWGEAFGLVVAEAMACGVAVLTSSAGGMAEVVGVCGEAGLTFRTGDVSDLAQKLHQLLFDATCRSKMGTAARKRVVQKFSLERMVSGYLDVYDELLGCSSSMRRTSASAN